MKLYEPIGGFVFLGFVLGGIFGGGQEKYSAQIRGVPTSVITVKDVSEICKKTQKIEPLVIYGDSDSRVKDYIHDCPKCDCKGPQPLPAPVIEPMPRSTPPAAPIRTAPEEKKKQKELQNKLQDAIKKIELPPEPDPRLDMLPTPGLEDR